MADVGTLTRKLLVDTPAIAALIGERMYPGRLPKSPTYPAVRYLVITENEPGSHSGATTLYQALVMVDVFGRGTNAYTTAAAVYEECLKLKQTAGKIVDNLTLERLFLENRRDGEEEIGDGTQEKLYRISFDLRLFGSRA